MMSYGGYIYDWPSKYHLVFWPLTDENWICVNTNNGYAAFNEDFEELSDTEKNVLAGWLEKNYAPSDPPRTYKEKLAWLEQVYGQRQVGDEFWSKFYRLMAFVHQEDREVCLSYVKKALPLLQKWRPSGLCRKEQLYLLGEYNRLNGNGEGAEALLRKAASTSIDRDMVISLLAAICSSLLFGLYLITRRRRVATYLGAALILAVAVLSVGIYTNFRQPDGYNEYLDEMIADRLDLLAGVHTTEECRALPTPTGDVLKAAPEE